MSSIAKRTLLVLASTYPRWAADPEPGFVHELCRRLVDTFDVIALVPDAPGADPSGMLDGVRVIRYRYAPRRLQTLVNHGGIAVNLKRSRWKWLLVPGFILAQYLAARRLARADRIDVVHAHWLLPQGLIARHLGVPYLVTSHGGDLFGLRGRLLTALKRLVAGSARAMTVVSSAMRDEASRLLITPPHLSVLPMGVDLREHFVPDRAQLRRADEILFVGRLVPKKGLRHLLDAMPAVLQARPAARLTIVGFGPEAESLQRQSVGLGIDANVTFLGARRQAELPDFYRRASVFVAPFVRDDSGDQEGLPVALMEAIGCGCPIVVGRVPGLQDLLGDAVDQLCVEPGRPDALADAILGVLDNPEPAEARTEAIRARALQTIDWQYVALGYAGLLAMCAEGTPIPASGR